MGLYPGSTDSDTPATIYGPRHGGQPIAHYIDADGDCWEWTGLKSQAGYGRITYRYKDYRAHRLIWELLVGPIPDELVLDHLCRNRACVNPDHLELVTVQENIRRGTLGSANRAKSHCPNGHEYSDANTYITAEGWRSCRRCHADAERRRRAG